MVTEGLNLTGVSARTLSFAPNMLYISQRHGKSLVAPFCSRTPYPGLMYRSRIARNLTVGLKVL